MADKPIVEKSEYEKGIPLPLCLNCKGVAARCRCSRAWTLPFDVVPEQVSDAERRERQKRADREIAYFVDLVRQDKLSREVAIRLGVPEALLP